MTETKMTRHTHPFCPGCVRDLALRAKLEDYLGSGPHHDMTEGQIAARDALVRVLDAEQKGAE